MKNKRRFLGGLVAGITVFNFIPNIVLASAYDDLVKSKEYTIQSVEPTSEDMKYVLSEKVYTEMDEKYDGWIIDFNQCNTSYTECKLSKNAGQELSDFYVTLKYVYDKDVKKVVDS